MCRIEVKVLLSGIRLSLLHLLHLAYLASKHSHLYGLYNKCTAYNQETIFLIFIFLSCVNFCCARKWQINRGTISQREREKKDNSYLCILKQWCVQYSGMLMIVCLFSYSFYVDG